MKNIENENKENEIKNEDEDINIGDYFVINSYDRFSSVVPFIERSNNKHDYGYDIMWHDCKLNGNLILKKISDEYAVEIGSGIKFLIDGLVYDEVIFKSLTNEEFLELFKKFCECPLIIIFKCHNPRKLNDENEMLYYLENFDKKMEKLKHLHSVAKETYYKKWKNILDTVYDIAKVDDMIYNCDKKYELKSGE